MSNVIFLGKVNLNWCDNCNVPLLGKKCDICNSPSRKVNVTPPGDFKFPLKGDFKILDNAFKNILKDNFSNIFSDRVIVLNRIPGPDRAEEIILGGYVVATVIHEFNSVRVALRPQFYPLAREHLMDIFVQADPLAVESIRKGNNLMAPGVTRVGNDVKKDHDVFILDDKNDPVAIGISKISKGEKMERGMAVKVKFLMDDVKIPNAKSDISKVVDANKNYMRFREERSIEMLKNLRDKEIFVSFSGGKDSLVSLHLTIRSGIKFKTLFLNTGLEFNETIDYVKKIAEKFSLDLDIIDGGNAFFLNLDHFGPPGRDYRWCCKVCKLGPTTRYIKNHSGKPIYMVIGQRAYESETRASKGEIWENRWVPNQIGISPIQHWNSLMIWIYIFEHGLEYNPWYDLGLWRTGCFMCPSQDQRDLNIVRDNYAGYKKWEDFLKNYAKSNRIPEYWVDYGLWKWNSLPEYLKRKFDFDGFKRTSISLEKIKNGSNFEIIPNKKIDMERLKNMMNILPRNFHELGDKIIINEKFLEQGIQVIYESEECVGCGICTGRCDKNALYLKDNRVWVDDKRCIHCTKCLGPCPAYVFK